MEPTLVTETSEVKTQTPGKFPEESTLEAHSFITSFTRVGPQFTACLFISLLRSSILILPSSLCLCLISLLSMSVSYYPPLYVCILLPSSLCLCLITLLSTSVSYYPPLYVCVLLPSSLCLCLITLPSMSVSYYPPLYVCVLLPSSLCLYLITLLSMSVSYYPPLYVCVLLPSSLCLCLITLLSMSVSYSLHQIKHLSHCFCYTKRSLQVRVLVKLFVKLLNLFGEELLAPHPTPRLKKHPLTAVHDGYSLHCLLPSISGFCSTAT
jgi:hypothetical protein